MAEIVDVAERRPIAVDLFAGAGGMSLGLEQAGYDVVAAVEVDPIHAAVHAFNFPDCVVIPRSVTEMAGEGIRKAAGIGNRMVDVVFGGPPCQGFSLIGKRAIDDPRNLLVREFVRLVSELRPRHFVMENVKGLTAGKQRQVLDELIEEFGSHDYSVKTPWRVLNAVDYGVPQDRQRLFLMGALNGETVPDYPDPLTRHPQKAGEPPAAPTCAEAIGDLPDADGFPELLNQDSVWTGKPGTLTDYARELRADGDHGWHFGHRRRWEPDVLTCSGRTNHSALSAGRFAATEPGATEPVSRFYRLRPDSVSNTLRAGTDAGRGAFTSPRPIHYRYPRCITVREMARLHGYPDWFQFHRTKWHGAREIGNSVPPPLARAVAGAIMKASGAEPLLSELTHPAMDSDMLSFDMGQACSFWNVGRTIGTRKSGG